MRNTRKVIELLEVFFVCRVKRFFDDTFIDKTASVQQKERIEDKLAWASGTGNKAEQMRDRKQEVVKKLKQKIDNVNNRSKKVKKLKDQLNEMNKKFIAAAKAPRGHDTTRSESDSD